jgi:hypothetical protein
VPETDWVGKAVRLQLMATLEMAEMARYRKADRGFSIRKPVTAPRSVLGLLRLERCVLLLVTA